MVALSPDERKQRLRRGEMAEVARSLGVSHSAVQSVVEGRSRSRRIELALSRKMKTPVDIAFPRIVKTLQPQSDAA
jgi:FAD synthase